MTTEFELRTAIPRNRSSPAPTHVHGLTSTSTALENETSSHPAELVHGSSSRAPDVESQKLPKYTCVNDPYQLSSKLKSVSELTLIRANTSRRSDGCGPLTSNQNASKARKIQDFYRSQNENIHRLLKPVDDHRREAKETRGHSQLQYKIAVNGSLVANILLACLQVYAAVASGSLSLVTTMADALFDPLSNVTLMAAHRAVNTVDPRKFPSGKARIENVGNITFCFLMTSVSAVIIAFSARDLIVSSHSGTKDFHLPSVIAVGVAFATKLALFIYCWALRDFYSQVRMLWEDHRNDLLINGFGILTSVGGSKLKWWIDPMGASVMSLLIAGLWLRTAYTEFLLLIGSSADTQTLQLITYISMTHSSHIRAIDTVRAYHSGPRLIVEVDVVMDPEETLRATHDIAEELQFKLESLPDVERAYVHVDYETSHAPEHFLKKEL